MTALRYHYIHHEILRMVLQHSGRYGYPADLTDLVAILRPAVPDIERREVVSALQRLQPQYLTVWKWDNRLLRYPDEINDEVEVFYRSDMYLQQTPHTDAYLQELATLFPAPEPELPKKTYGFLRPPSPGSV